MFKKLKDKYFIMSVITLIGFVFIFINLFKLQIINHSSYLDKSKSHLSTSEVIWAPRGKILDRYGRPIVTNKLGFSVSFCDANLTNDQLNDLILNTLELFKLNNDAYIDTFPMEFSDGKYIFKYNNLEGDQLEEKVRNAKFALGISDNLNEDECVDALKEKFGIDSRYTKEEILDIITVRYEMLIRNFFNSSSFVISNDVSLKTVSAIEENNEFYKGLDIISSQVRNYVNDTMAAHILGTVGIIYQEEYEKLKNDGYTTNSVIGKAGLEKVLEKDIRGINGTKKISQTIGSDPLVSKTDAIPGNNAMLTIDLRLQKVAEDMLKKTIDNIKIESINKYGNAGSDVGGGCVIVEDIQTGEILAMANYPTYNPATFNKDYNKLSLDTQMPLFNRAISGMYPPGSVFKMLTTIAAMEEGVVDKNTLIEDKGKYEYYDQVFNCWIYTQSGETHGMMDAANALKNSCNYYYYEVAKRLGNEKIYEYGKKMMLGEKTGIEIDGESRGILANPEYKKANFNQVWYPGDTLQMAIGQSYNLFTPISLSNYVSTIANKGTIYTPYLIKSIVDYKTGKQISENKPKIVSKIEMGNDTYETITYGMRLVSQDGTAASIFKDFPIEVCSKTGSSQVNGGSANGLFVSYAPYKNPKISVTVVIENAGSGSVTAPIARAIYEQYFNLSTNNSKDIILGDCALVS